ncbi:DUF6366 family protein [Salinicoccus roseus]|uniref:DUF6366 family protein n=1 Tax=Salinicoccus roseus TaxID=45670 RepID=A0A0C2E4K2_9STAP|nr:DUF6366 family protein [Salinicoccus roseus]KIH70277.1 phage capsid protein [Salinicoccus roseus]MDB0581143.1 DUF6366 family protein [Salinicoccus roseus]
MHDDNESAEQRRERLRRKESKNHPAGNLKDASERAGSGSMTDMAGSMGWKGLGLLILLFMVGLAVGLFFF